MNFHETSAFTGSGVPEMIEDILSQVYVQKIRPQILDPAGAASSSNNG